MSSLRTVAKNTAFGVAGEVISKVASLLLYAVMARALGQQGFGDFTFALSLALLFTTFAGFGTDSILTRAVARDRLDVDRLFWNALSLKLAIGVPGVLAAVAVAAIGDYSHEVRVTVGVLAVAALLETLAKTPHATFQAFDTMRPVAASLILQRLVTATLGIGAMALGAEVVVVSIMYLGGAFLGLAYAAWALARRSIRPALNLSTEQARGLFMAAVPIGLASVFGTIVFRVDAAILSLLKDNIAVGLYGAAYRVLESTLFLTYSFVSVALPALSRLGRDTRPTIATAFEGASKVIVAVSFPIGVGFALFSLPITELLFGVGFRDAATAVRLLSVTAALYGLSYLASHILVSQNRQKAIPWIVAAVAVENIGLNLLLIPTFSFNGAAAATSISEVTRATLMMAFALRVSGRISAVRVLAGPALACGGMALVAVPLGLGLPAAIVAVAVYPLLLLVIERRLFPSDVTMIMNVLRRRQALT